MTVGTQGNDNLSNDPSVYNEVVDALAGDDVVTVVTPFRSTNTYPTIEVNGGDGFDTLIASAYQITGFSSSGIYNSFYDRTGSSHGYTVRWSSIERFQLTAGLYGPSPSVITGASADILRLSTIYHQNIIVETNDGDDEIYFSAGSGLGGTISISAGSGDDIIDFTGNSASYTRTGDGGEGNDILRGSASVDRLLGGAGDDTINGGAGIDTMIGGTGNDIYFVDNAGDAVTEADGEGIDEVRTSLGSTSDHSQMYTLPDHVENLTGTSAGAQGVHANALNNVVTMGAGNDLVVVHHGGDDTVFAGGGNDFIHFGDALTAEDKVDGGAGTDTVGLLGPTI